MVSKEKGNIMSKEKCDLKSYDAEIFSTYAKHEVQKSHHRIIKKLLEVIEDLRDQRFNVSIESYVFFRKKILDSINDETRNIEGIFNKFDLSPKDIQNENTKD